MEEGLPMAFSNSLSIVFVETLQSWGHLFRPQLEYGP
jgi:hypothetical protein